MSMLETRLLEFYTFLREWDELTDEILGGPPPNDLTRRADAKRKKLATEMTCRKIADRMGVSVEHMRCVLATSDDRYGPSVEKQFLAARAASEKTAGDAASSAPAEPAPLADRIADLEWRFTQWQDANRSASERTTTGRKST